MVLRPGYITPQMLSEVLGEEVIIDPGIIAADDTRKPKAPGMKYKHYAPKSRYGNRRRPSDAVVSKINALVHQKQENGQKVAVIATEESDLLITPMSFFPWAAVPTKTPLHSICTKFCVSVMNCM